MATSAAVASGSAEIGEFFRAHQRELEDQLGAAVSSICEERPAAPLIHLIEKLQDMADEAPSALEKQFVLHAYRAEPDDKQGDVDQWSAEGWFSSLALGQALAESFVAPLQQQNRNGTRELEFIKQLGSNSALLDKLLRAALPMLRDVVRTACNELVEARAATASELISKFQHEDHAFEYAFGGQEDFLRGLGGIVGSPSPHVLSAMEQEHCKEVDSRTPFTTGNYGVRTTCEIEWRFVDNPEVSAPSMPAVFSRCVTVVS